MVETVVPAAEDKPVIAASMFGNTTDCVNHAKDLLEAADMRCWCFTPQARAGARWNH